MSWLSGQFKSVLEQAGRLELGPLLCLKLSAVNDYKNMGLKATSLT